MNALLLDDRGSVSGRSHPLNGELRCSGYIGGLKAFVTADLGRRVVMTGLKLREHFVIPNLDTLLVADQTSDTCYLNARRSMVPTSAELAKPER